MSEVPRHSSNSQNEGPSRKRGGLLRSSAITGSMTMVSRVLGLVRDIVIAKFFGPGDGADAFFLAFKIPNFLRRLFAEGAFNQAFVPVLSEYRSTRSHDEVRGLIASVAARLGTVLLLLSAFVILAAPLISIPIAYGFRENADKFALFVDMLQITFPYLFLISMAAFVSAILNSYDKFAVPAVTPSLLNIALIASAVFLSPYMERPEIALAIGVFIAGVAQLMFQLPLLARMRLLPIPRFNSKHEGVQRIMTLMVPALFGVSVSQINLLFDTFIASLLVSGSVSWLYFSDRLVELPLGIFGIAIATVVLPSLSRKHASEFKEEFAATLDWAFRMILIIAVPASLALIVLAEPLIITLFQGQNFSVDDVIKVTSSLQAYTFGLLAFMSIKVFAPGYYSRQDTKTPVKIGVIAMLANMGLNAIFVFGFNLAHTGLALATSVAAFINAGLLLRGLLRQGVFRFQSGWLVFLLRLVLANALMVCFLVFTASAWQEWLDWGVWTRIGQLCLLCLGGLGIYLAVLYLAGLRFRELLEHK
ncbi:MAG: murein biosynthesis integral membrane protein MurJ [Pseudohongiellaceae bacterium]|nr:murein biosynthesis integral membrane protein MurJ [Pseudohongiellaceae bacterium]